MADIKKHPKKIFKTIIFSVLSILICCPELVGQTTYQVIRYPITDSTFLDRILGVIQPGPYFDAESAAVYLLYHGDERIEQSFLPSLNDIIILYQRGPTAARIGYQVSSAMRGDPNLQTFYRDALDSTVILQYKLIASADIDTITVAFSPDSSKFYAKLKDKNPEDVLSKKYIKIKLDTSTIQIDIGLDSTRIIPYNQIFALAEDNSNGDSITLKYRAADSLVPAQISYSVSPRITLREQMASPTADDENDPRSISFYTDSRYDSLRKFSVLKIDPTSGNAKDMAVGFVYAHPQIDIESDALMVKTAALDSLLAQANKKDKLRWLFSIPAVLMVLGFAL